MTQNPGQFNSNDDILIALDTTGISDAVDNRINPATEEKQDDTITALGAVSLTVTNAIDSTAFDLNAAAFSVASSISNDFILDNIELNFSTAESKTITITSADGTVIWSDTNTDTSVFLSNMKIAFNGGDNITVAVTQFTSAGTMDCILRTKNI